MAPSSRSADDSIEALTSETKVLTKLKNEDKMVLMNEKSFRKKYSNLLAQHNGILQTKKDDGDLEDYTEESLLLSSAIASERNAWIIGITCGLGVFVSFRYLPKYFIRQFGSTAQIEKLKQAELDAKTHNFAWSQNILSVFIESAFSLWIGFRAKAMASRLSESAYDVIADIPLVAGKSVVSDALCPSWIKITHEEIPTAFWKTLNESENGNDNATKLHEEQNWRAIRKFSDNCVKRKLYERVVRKDVGLSKQQQEEQQESIALPNKVPDYVTKSSSLLTREQILQLVADRPTSS